MPSTDLNILLERWTQGQVSETEVRTFLAQVTDEDQQAQVAQVFDQFFAAPTDRLLTDAERQAALAELLEKT